MKNAIVAFLLALLPVANGREVDLSAPQTKLGAANSEGVVRWFTELCDFSFGKVSLPVRLDFSSARHTTSPFGGWGFGCGLMEAKAVLIRENLMRVDLLCAKTMYLKRDRSTQERFYTLDKEWLGELKSGEFVVSRDDGWKLVFRGENGGRIHEIRTDEGRTLSWVYAGDMPIQLREGGKVILDTQIDEHTKLLKRLTVAGKSFEFEYAKRPIVREVQGTRLIEGFKPAIAHVASTKGKFASFEFSAREKDLTPDVEISDFSTQSKKLGWNPTTGKIAFEDQWTYDVTLIDERGARPEMTRFSPEGRKEYYHFDNQSGTITYVDENGLSTVTKVFRTEGPLYDKVREVQKGTAGRLQIVYKASFDETGRLIRQVSEGSKAAVFGWTKSKRLETITKGDVTLLRRKFDDKDRLVFEEFAGGTKTEIQYNSDGSQIVTAIRNGKVKKRLVKPESEVNATVKVARTIPEKNLQLPNPLSRDQEIAKLVQEAESLKDHPRQRAEKLLYIGQRFSSDSRWPMDPAAALRIYRAVAEEFSSDALISLKARAWIATVCGHSHESKERLIEETKLALSIDGHLLSEADKREFARERSACFHNLLMLSRTGILEKDLEIFDQLGKQFARTPEDEQKHKQAAASILESEAKSLLGKVEG